MKFTQEKITDAAEWLVYAGETAIGAKLLSDLAMREEKEAHEHEASQPRISRREFIDSIKLLASAYLLSPGISEIGRMASHEAKKGVNPAAELHKAVTSIHPEHMILVERVRNVLIAHKAEFVMEQFYRKTGRPQRSVTAMGALHTPIENQFLNSPEERLDFLKQLSPLLKRVLQPASLFSIVSYDYDTALLHKRPLCLNRTMR